MHFDRDGRRVVGSNSFRIKFCYIISCYEMWYWERLGLLLKCMKTRKNNLSFITILMGVEHWHLQTMFVKKLPCFRSSEVNNFSCKGSLIEFEFCLRLTWVSFHSSYIDVGTMINYQWYLFFWKWRWYKKNVLFAFLQVFLIRAYTHVVYIGTHVWISSYTIFLPCVTQP